MDKNQEDIIYVKRIINGDINAFEFIVDKYQEKLLSYILRISNINITEAENLIQEVFIKVYQKINSFNLSKQFSTWIYKIAYNHTLDYHRKNKKEIEHKYNFSDEKDNNYTIENIVDKDKDILSKIKKDELYKRVKELIIGLKPQVRDIIMLKYYEDLSYDDISEIMEIPVGTIGTIINRAKKDLKNNLLKFKD